MKGKTGEGIKETSQSPLKTRDMKHQSKTEWIKAQEVNKKQVLPVKDENER